MFLPASYYQKGQKSRQPVFEKNNTENRRVIVS